MVNTCRLTFLSSISCTAALCLTLIFDHAVAQQNVVRSLDYGPITNPDPDPYPSTYQRLDAPPTALVGGTMFDGAGNQIDNASILFQDGTIVAVGADVTVPEGTHMIDASGKWITPGIIDNHSHLGIAAAPPVAAHRDIGELSTINAAHVWGEHSVWPQDPAMPRAVAGGVTTVHVLTGSSNLFSGRTVVLKLMPGRTAQDMKLPDAPYGLKMACGENPKRIFGGRGLAPQTRMGSVAIYRESWLSGMSYQYAWDLYRDAVQKGDPGARPPTRDLKLETLAAVLRGEILVHIHCYRADEMATLMQIADEFGFKVAAFHHAAESYKVADLLAEHGACSSMWADWWGWRMESLDGIRENIALVHAAGACAVVHSDSNEDNQRLNQEAAKALDAGLRMGLDISKAEAFTWLTLNPAKSIGIDDRTGTLEPGKMADVVLWDGDPFSVYTRAEKVFIDGAMVFDRTDPDMRWTTDFEVVRSEEGVSR